jgi:penicillin amidase
MSRHERWTIHGEAEIRIERDEHGVPHVQASTEADLYRGLGYCHARDRGLQMLLARVLGQGRACELLQDSDEMLALDRFFRRMDFGSDAAAEAAKLDEAPRRVAQAYCDGANAAFRRRLPWELRLLGYRPEPWTVTNAVLISRLIGYVSLAQSQGQMERLLVEMVQAGVPLGHLQALFPALLDGLDIELLERVRLVERLVPDAVRWNPAVPRAIASNNWVLSGRKTASGHALLANDPHLEANRLPAVWYEIVLELDGRYCIAATMPGIPGALLGRTNDLAWGATYTFMDAIDSWIEDCRDARYRRVVNGRETWEPFRVRTEVIRRRRGPDVTVKFYENEHGGLDGDPNRPGVYLATRWASGAGTGSRTMAAIFGILHATDARQGMDLLGKVETAWNWVVADRSGNIGYQMSGCMPRRRPGHRGVVPLPGWDPENDWQGLVPQEELPQAFNPESGFLVTANDDLNHLGRAHPITLPMGAYRAERIAALLAERDDWTPATVQSLQMDVYSLQAERFMAILRPLLPQTENGARLREWDCRYDRDSTGAFLFETFYRALIVEVFGAVCGAAVPRFLIEETGVMADFYANFDGVLLDAASVWYGEEGRDAVFQRVAARALAGPVRTWGSQRRVMMKHLLLGGRLPEILGFDHGPVELIGGRATIHQGQIYRSAGRETTFAPSYRLVTDLGEPVAYTCLAGGPSDRRLSRWYTSGVSDWLAGRFKALRPHARAVGRATWRQHREG